MKHGFRRIVNLLLYLVFCFLFGTGLLLTYRLPPGSRGGHGLQALGMGRHDWGDLHFYAGWLFLALVVIHLVLSWGWLMRVAADRRLWPVLAGLLAGLGLIAWILSVPVVDVGGGPHH